MTVFYVSNMKCVHCEARINEGFKKAGINAEVVLPEKTVKVADEDREKAAELLDDLGFDAEVKTGD